MEQDTLTIDVLSCIVSIYFNEVIALLLCAEGILAFLSGVARSGRDFGFANVPWYEAALERNARQS
jgi:hypothetical protein